MNGEAKLMEDRAWSLSQKLLLALVSLAVLLDGFDNQALGFALPSLMKDWGVPKSALGGALAAAQFGMLIGAISGGMVGDRMGRKLALVSSVVLFGVATLMIGFAGSPAQLGALRFIAGLGLGAAFPNVAALATEFTPARHRSLAVIISIVCVPLGGVVGGMAASVVLPLMGWQALFVLAGGCTLALAAVLALVLPESVTFLLCSGASEARISSSLRRMGLGEGAMTGMPSIEPAKEASLPLSAVLAPAWRKDTLLVWMSFFFSLMAVYSAFNWLPTLLSESGLSVAQAAQGLAAFNMGGVVAALMGGRRHRTLRFTPCHADHVVDGGSGRRSAGHPVAFRHVSCWDVYAYRDRRRLCKRSADQSVCAGIKHLSCRHAGQRRRVGNGHRSPWRDAQCAAGRGHGWSFGLDGVSLGDCWSDGVGHGHVEPYCKARRPPLNGRYSLRTLDFGPLSMPAVPASRGVGTFNAKLLLQLD